VEKEKEIENLKNTLALRDQELQNIRQELSKCKAYAIELKEVKNILDNNNNQNNTSLADAAKASLNTKQQEIDRKATEKFHVLKKKWEDFDKPLEFQSYYVEKIEQKVKEIEDRIGKNVFELLGSQEWKINCNKCGLGYTLKFNAKEISDLFQNGFIDMRCNSNNIPKIPKPPSLSINPRKNFSDQGQVQPKHTIMITLHSLIQNYLQ
jgi:DNA repair exonuclease SbcCD ATPase subunit